MIRRAIAPWTVAAILALAPSASSLGWIAQKPTTLPGTQQLLLSNTTTATTLTRFFSVGFTAAHVTTEVPFSTIPIDGAIRGMYVYVNVTPTTTTAWTATLRVGGVDQAMTCTLNLGNVGKCSVTGTVPIAAGDLVNIALRISSGAPPSTNVSASLVFQPTTANETMILSQGPGMSGSSTGAVNPFTQMSSGAPASRLGGSSLSEARSTGCLSQRLRPRRPARASPLRSTGIRWCRRLHAR